MVFRRLEIIEADLLVLETLVQRGEIGEDLVL